MKKISDKDGSDVAAAPDPELASPPTVVFSDNPQVLDYLNSLLASSPQLNPEFNTIRFLCNPAEEEPGSVSSSGTVVDNVLYFGSERSKARLKELKNEIGDLKMKVARLTAQLNDTECRLDVAMTENRNLHLDIFDLQNQLETARAVTKSTTPRLEPVVIMDTTTEGEPAPEPEVATAQVTIDVEPDPGEKEGLELFAQQDLTRYGAAALTSAQAVIVAQNPLPDIVPFSKPQPALEPAAEPQLTCSATAERAAPIAVIVPPQPRPDAPPVARHTSSDALLVAQEPIPSVVIATQEPRPDTVRAPEQRVEKSDREVTRASSPATHVVSEQTVRESDRGPSRKTTASEQPVPRARQSSSIIKSTIVKRHQAELEDQSGPEFLAQPLIAPEKPTTESVKNPQPVQLQPPVDLLIEPEALTQNLSNELLHSGMDETNLEPAPESKVIVRKHIGNYREIQREAEAAEVKTGHDIIWKG